MSVRIRQPVANIHHHNKVVGETFSTQIAIDAWCPLGSIFFVGAASGPAGLTFFLPACARSGDTIQQIQKADQMNRRGLQLFLLCFVRCGKVLPPTSTTTASTTQTTTTTVSTTTTTTTTAWLSSLTCDEVRKCLREVLHHWTASCSHA